MRRSRLFVLFAMAAAMPLDAAAAQQPQATAEAGQADPDAVVAEVRRVLSERYVLPERRPALDIVLADGLSSGRYDVADPQMLASRINADLERVGRDRHLYFRFEPRQAAMLVARDDAAAPDNSAYERQVRVANHGITELRVLPGNVRYMALDAFYWIGAESAAAHDNAMRFLGGGEAIIIDLRRNGGGASDATDYLVSHFLPAGQHLYTFYQGSETNRAFSLEDLPAGRLAGKPLYVLTSGTTASAAEAFAGIVGGYRLGEVVGATTAGAGFMNDLVPVAGRYVLSVSIARVVIAPTARDWEATGIAPTMAAPVTQALDAAHVHALRRIIADLPEQERSRLEPLAEAMAARLEPRAPALPLAAYAGRFGERTIVAEENRLYYQRGTAFRTLLIPLGRHRFAFDSDPAMRLEFTADGNSADAFAITPVGLPAQGPYRRTP